MQGPNVNVANIRQCYNGAMKAHGDAVAVDNPWPPSAAQIKYVLGLQAERVLPDNYVIKSEDDLEAMDKGDVSALIGTLKLFRRSDSAAVQPTYTLPAGRYALRLARGGPQENDHVWQFFEVSKPTEGRWKGYTFIKRLIGAPGDYQKVDMPKGARGKVLALIERDPKTAMLDYGTASGVCGRCSSPLSDPTSLALGIGPKCRTMSGWF